MLHKYGTADIGVKSLGELNTEGWYEVCKDKFSTPDAYMNWVSKIDDKLRTQTFNPLKRVPDGNSGKEKVLFPLLFIYFCIVENYVPCTPITPDEVGHSKF